MVTLELPNPVGPNVVVPFWPVATPERISFRQLRHQTKNALQRLLWQIEACPGLQHDAAGRTLAAELTRRIQLSATVSDTLFGLTTAPGPLQVRLDAMSRAVVALMADDDQEIAVETTVHGTCPEQADVLVQVAHELVGNAVKHGMTLRMVGCIELVVVADEAGVTLTVADDGWGFCEPTPATGGRGDGLRIAELLARQHGGRVDLRRDRCQTVATLHLPPRPAEGDA